MIGQCGDCQILVTELERLYEAARCMADPEHCLHHTREYLPWNELAAQAKKAISQAYGQRPTCAHGVGPSVSPCQAP